MIKHLLLLTLTPVMVIFSTPDLSLAQSFEATPFQLVNLAYEGYLEAAGVPSRRQLERLYNRHRIDAEALVEAGITAGYLPPSRRTDRVFINAVSTQMQSLRDRNAPFDWR
jgi:hypothetical protein